MHGHVVGTFRRSIGVEERDGGVLLQPSAAQRSGQGFTGREEPSKSGQARQDTKLCLGIEHALHQGGNGFHNCHGVFF